MADWAKLKVVDLKAELKRRDLNANGLKAELVSRLEEDDASRDAGDGDRGQEAVAEEAGDQEEAAASATEQPASEELEDAPPAAAPEVKDEAASIVRDATESSTVEHGVKESTSPAAEPAQEPMQIEETTTSDSASRPDPTAASPAAKIPAATEASTAAEGSPSLESQKRKRRSLSPPPVEEDVARKRVRADSNAGPKNGVLVESKSEIMSDAPPTSRSPTRDSKSREPTAAEPVPEPAHEPTSERRDEMDLERDVSPALHPATSALYINNLMRPLRPLDLRTHLASLAPPASASPADDVIETFFLDQIRTHAIVVFDSTSSASRVRTALHDRVWPEESNRKALWVDFVPPEKVQGWIDTEDGAGRGARTGSRWEVVYETLENGEVEVHLESGAVSSSRPGPPPPSGRAAPLAPSHPPYDGTNSVPLGPRGFRSGPIPPPTGPRSSREQSSREQYRPDPSRASPPPGPPGSLTTRARPSVSYRPVAPDLARARISAMQDHYTRDTKRPLGREINRYYFEDGDKFVDRGKEVFEGIRPPHRERGGGGGGGGGGFRGRGRGGPRRGGGGGRRGGDSYMPGRGRADEGRLPRYPDDR